MYSVVKSNEPDNTVLYRILDDGEFLFAVDPGDVGELLNQLTGTDEGQEWLVSK